MTSRASANGEHVSRAQAQPIEFYDFAPSPGVCPYAQRAWLTFLELDLPYEHKLIEPSNRGEEFLSVYRTITQDPEANGKVPTIIDGNFKLTESAVVVEYLDNKYGKPGQRLLPEDPEEHALVKLFTELFTTLFNSVIFTVLRADTRESLAEAHKQFDKNLKKLDDYIKANGKDDGGDYFLGSRYSYAEVLTTPFLRRAAVILPHLKEYSPVEAAERLGLDRLSRWYKAALARPSSQQSGPSDEQLQNSWGKFNTPLKD
ncbi:hypothetical protein WJX74_005465 [Apatococcus lobatus]|uniref:Glutathione S-transferase n=2 Tax=Apatococcus TaxID=904362 RepID=A0AAW1TGA2_9CHLO